jgi:sugar (pentulose or hexulose) kinase
MGTTDTREPALNTHLGIDYGTSAVRICAIDDEDQIQAMVHCALETQSTQAWKASLVGALQQLFQRIPATSVRSIAVDGTSGTVLLCDESGQPLAGPAMYDDASFKCELDSLKAPVRVPALSATAGLPKIMGLARQLSDRPLLIQHQSDWITGLLTDQFNISDENNALKTGYDAQRRCWPDWVRSALPDNVELPQVVIPGSSVGNTGKLMQSLGVAESVTIRAGTTDSTASFLATGVDKTDCGVTTLGSTLVIKQLSDHEITDLPRGIYSHRLGDVWLTGGASNTGGAVLTEYFSLEEIKLLSSKINPLQPTGLDYYPLIRPGERFPVNDPERQPTLTPRPHEDRAFLQGMLEGIGKIEKFGYMTLNSLGCDRITTITTAGGGAANEEWTQIRERILGCRVTVAGHAEAAYGSALLAKYGETLFDKFN